MNLKNLINKIGLCILPTLGGFLGAFGGADNSSKMYRRIIIPGLLTSYAYSNTESLFVITIMSMAGTLALGYGLPSHPGDIYTWDKGSQLGRFYYNLFKYNQTLANIFTRGSIGLLIGISLISVPIIKHNWLIYILGVLGIMFTNAFISWRDFGSYKLFNKTLSTIETIVWGLITLFGVTIIYF